MKIFSGLFLFTGLLLFAACNKQEQDLEKEKEPSYASFEEELDAIVERFADMGTAVAVIDSGQEIKLFYYGTVSTGATDPPDEHSVFDIGSVTKVFTTTLLAQMCLEGDLSCSDSVMAFLDSSLVSIPSKDGVNITLEHLATHTSGLPRAPQSSSYPEPEGYYQFNPYALYTTQHIYEYLSGYCQLLFTPGERFSYSNTGMGLLGHVLGVVDGTDFEQALTSRVLDPIGMDMTTLFLTEDQKERLAPGHRGQGPMPNYTAQDILQGAGFLKSDLADMLVFLKANLGMVESPLSDAMKLAHRPVVIMEDVTMDYWPGRQYDYSIGLGWQITHVPEGHTITWSGGKTSGYIAYIGMELEKGTGCIILCNSGRSNVIIRFGEEVMIALHKY